MIAVQYNLPYEPWPKPKPSPSRPQALTMAQASNLTSLRPSKPSFSRGWLSRAGTSLGLTFGLRWILAKGAPKIFKIPGVNFFHLRSHRHPPFKTPKCGYVGPKMAIPRKTLEFFPSPLSIEQQFS